MSTTCVEEDVTGGVPGSLILSGAMHVGLPVKKFEEVLYSHMVLLVCHSLKMLPHEMS